jgi:deoxycytidylate deaminase
MYLAKSVSLRSSDLSRQVGASIFVSTGEVISLGSNEVPRSGGGTYWSGEAQDHRDVVEGHDPNEMRKVEVLVDIVDRLRRGGHLEEALCSLGDSYVITKHLLEENAEHAVADSKIMDLIEFGRAIHAEMSAHL